MFEEIRKQAYEAASELIEKANLKAGSILVVGCSTSEVMGSRIGTDSNPEAARAAAARAGRPTIRDTADTAPSVF